MHLSKSQSDRLYNMLEALVVFGNATYHVVANEELLLPDGSVNAEACAQVLDRVWEDPAIIDAYVERNPSGLPPRGLAQMARWKDRVTGPQLLLGYDERGRALFSVGGCRVAVAGVTQDLSEVVPDQPPAVVLVTLLPFEDVVTYDTIVRSLPISYGSGMREMLERELEDSVAYPLVERADDFVELARRERGRRERDEWDQFQRRMDRERWERDGSEPMVTGVHRGLLAGLTVHERKERVREELERLAAEAAPLDAVADLRSLAQRSAPADTLAGTLATDTKYALAEDARRLGLKGMSSLRKAELAERVAREWLEDPELLSGALVTCPEDEFDTFCELVASPGGRLEFAEKDAGEHALLVPSPPISRLYWHDGTFTALVPDELRAQAAELGLDSIRARRGRLDRVVHLAEVMTELCGVVPVQELPARHEELYGEAIGIDGLVDDLFMGLRHSGDLPPYGIWLDRAAEGYDVSSPAERVAFAYVVHYRLSDAEIAEGAREDVMDELEGKAPRDRKGAESLIDRLEQAISVGCAERDELVRTLLSEHARKEEHGPCPLDPALASGDAFAWKLGLPATTNLLGWLDAHVPDGENDLLYANDVVAELLEVQLSGSDPRLILEAASQMGLFETSEDVEGMVGRIIALSNALPDWWNNGWSPDALLERMTGRKVFRNPDGTPMRVGRNDPCPCGSGKKYKKCCGR